MPAIPRYVGKMIEIKNLSKTFTTADGTVEALKDVSLSIEDGDIFGIIGCSGAGKSTLIRMINALEVPTSGSVNVNGVEINKLGFSQLQRERKKIGMIFQQFNLVNAKTVYQNVVIPLLIGNYPKDKIDARAREVLSIVGLEDKADSYPDQLSGGQKQRVGIARALATGPDILLSDEATSALDPDTMEQILDLLREINRSLHITIVLVTHQIRAVQKICNKVAVMQEGKVIEFGSVYEVFSNPQQPLTNDFVRTVIPDQLPKAVEDWLKENKPSNSKIYRLKFVQNNALSSLLYEVNSLFKTETKILHAAVAELEKHILGIMVVQFIGESTTIDEIVSYMKKKGVVVEEVQLV